MMKTQERDKELNEQHSSEYGFVNKTEDEKLLQEMNRSYTEKLQSFTKMLRRNKAINKAVITIKN